MRRRLRDWGAQAACGGAIAVALASGLACASGVGATASAAAASTAPRSLNFQQLGVRDGLAQEIVTAIAQDGTGYMWFGSQHGLSRYDGYRTVVYRTVPNNARSLADNWVEVLHVDRQRRLWVGTRAGLQRFEPSSGDFTRFAPPTPHNGSRTPTAAVKAIASDAHGILWLGTNEGLQRLDPATGRYTILRHRAGDPSSLASDQVNALAIDARGALWVGTKNGLDRLAPGATTFVHFALDSPDAPDATLNDVQQLHVDRAQGLWVISMAGLVGIDLADGALRRHVFGQAEGLAPGLVTAMTHDADGTLWVGTNTAGLQRFDRGLQRFVAIPADPHQVAAREVSSLFQDRSGSLWVGTWTAGVRHVDLAGGGFSRYFHVPGDARTLSDNRIYGMCADGDGGVLLAGFGGIDRLDPASGVVGRLHGDARFDRHMRNNEIVLSVYRDRRGRTWMGSSAELARFDPKSGHYAAHRFRSNDPNSNSITHVTGDDAGTLWVSSRGGLHRVRNSGDGADGADASYRHDASDPGSLSDDWVHMSLEDAGGALWVATDNGLNLLAPGAAAFRHFFHDAADGRSLSSDRVQTLFMDHAGGLWVGTNAGLNRVVRDAAGKVAFKRYTTRDGLADDSIGGILEDGRGQLWISTSDGISRFDPARGTFRNYAANAGMIEGYYFSGAAYRDADGTMYFGGVNGLTVFHPDRIRDNPAAPAAVVTSMQADGVPLTAPGARRLAHDTAVLTFEFAALHYSDPQHNRFRYRLAGYQRAWMKGDAGKPLATYTNLDPGHYTFEVQAAYEDGAWGVPAPPVAFDIVPPFWQTRPFQAAAIAVLLALMWTGDALRTRMHARRRRALELQVRARTEQVQHQKEALEEAQARLQRYVEERERLFMSISHDLRSPITRLKLRSELLDDDALRGEFNEDLDDLDMMVKEALQTVKDSDIHENTTAVRLDGLLGRLTRGAQLAGSIVDFAPSGIVVQAKPLALKRVIGNLIDNAMSYGGRVSLSTELCEEVVHIHVRDYGPGVSEDDLARMLEPNVRLEHGRNRNPGGLGLGLSIAIGITEAQGGELLFKNHPEGGLIVTVVLPITTLS